MAKHFFISILIFPEERVKKIIGVVLSLLEDEARQGNHLRIPGGFVNNLARLITSGTVDGCKM